MQCIYSTASSMSLGLHPRICYGNDSAVYQMQESQGLSWETCCVLPGKSNLLHMLSFYILYSTLNLFVWQALTCILLIIRFECKLTENTQPQTELSSSESRILSFAVGHLHSGPWGWFDATVQGTAVCWLHLQAASERAAARLSGTHLRSCQVAGAQELLPKSLSHCSLCVTGMAS